MILLRTISGIARCCTAAFAVALAVVPAAAKAQQATLAEPDNDLSLYGDDLSEGHRIIPQASYLDPTIEQPGQSIQQFAEPPGEVLAPLPCGPLKHIFISATWLHGDDLGFTDFELSSAWAWPTINQYSMLTLTPGVALHLVDGPATPDLPAQLYDASLDIKWLVPFSTTFAIELGLTPGVFSDFEADTDDAFRLGARIVGYYVYSPTIKLAFGASYLDRFDVEAIPVGGLIWTPDVATELQLTFPRGKFARRLRVCGCAEDWWYIAGDFNGGAWAIERANGVDDAVGYRDLRFTVGWERRTPKGPTAAVEAGIVVERQLEYESGLEYEPDQTFIVRGTFGF